MRHASDLSGKPVRDHPEEGEVARRPGEPADHDEGMTPAKNRGKEEVWPQFFKDPIEVSFSSILSVQWFCDYAELYLHYNSVLKPFHHPQKCFCVITVKACSYPDTRQPLLNFCLRDLPFLDVSHNHTVCALCTVFEVPHVVARTGFSPFLVMPLQVEGYLGHFLFSYYE